MNTTPRRNITTVLFKPFEFVAGGRALLLGLAAIGGAALIGSAFQAHFDGAIDLHVGRGGPVWLFLAEGAFDWLALACVLLLMGRLVSRTRFRAVDIFGTQALARWPTLVMAAAVSAPSFQRVSQHMRARWVRSAPAVEIHPGDHVMAGLILCAVLLLLVWLVALMYQAYATCCNLKGARAAVSFIGGLLVAEIISKALPLWFNAVVFHGTLR